MADTTGAAAWLAVGMAGAAALGVHPSGIAAAALGAGVGLVFGHGLGRWAAMALAGLMTLASPLLASWAVSWRPDAFGRAEVATAGLSFVIAFLAPVLLRGVLQHAPVLVEAAMSRLATVIRGSDRRE